MAGLSITVHQQQTGTRHIVGVEEFAERRTRAPKHQLGVAPELGFMHLANQGREYVGVLEREIIAQPVEVAGHCADEVAPVLLAGEGTELDPSNLGDGVSLIGNLEWAGEERRLLNRLRGELRVDATGTQKQ